MSFDKKNFGDFSHEWFDKKPYSQPRFDEVIAQEGENYEQAMARVIKKRVGYYFKDGRAFNGGTVLDVGSRDGRFLQMIKELGAEKVKAIEPDISDISEEIKEKLKTADLFEGTIEELETNGDKYDGALVLNCSPIANATTMVESLANQIKEDGVVIFSFAEKEPTYDRFLPLIQKHFREVKINGNVGDKEWGPHKIIVIATK